MDRPRRRSITTAGPPARRFGPAVPAADVLAMARWLSFAPPNTFDLLDEAHRRWPDMSLRDFRAAHYLAAAMLLPTEGNA
jgi:hypothetical protein